MFEFDATKLLIVGVVALIVIGPKDLPRVLRQLGQFVGKTRRMASEFQSQFMEAIKESELDDIRKDVASVRDATKLDIGFNPIATIRSEITSALIEKPVSPAASAAPAVMTPLPAPAEPVDITPYGEGAEKNAIDLAGLSATEAPASAEAGEPIIAAATAPVADATEIPADPLVAEPSIAPVAAPRPPVGNPLTAGFTTPPEPIETANDGKAAPDRPHLAKTGEA